MKAADDLSMNRRSDGYVEQARRLWFQEKTGTEIEQAAMVLIERGEQR